MELLIKFCQDAIESFEKDMAVADDNYMKEDYAYAEGARNAYQVILKKLAKELFLCDSCRRERVARKIINRWYGKENN